MTARAFWLAGKPVLTDNTLPVLDKYSGAVIAHVALAGPADIDAALAAAVAAEAPMAALASYERAQILEQLLAGIQARFEELAQLLCAEAGKAIKDARGEVQRLIDTVKIAAGEATRIYGEVLPLDISARTRAYRGMSKRVPIGTCAFVTPFNFPLNLVAHKIAPAIAAGCPFVLKPASYTPLSALVLGEILAETALPPGAFSILPSTREAADLLVTDERSKLLSFTGSAPVGWDMKARAGKKKVTLELGGNAACIVHDDVNIDDAVARMIIGAYYQSGQSCISVQRILIHENVYEEVRGKLVAATQALIAGNPFDEKTFIGPLISEKEAQRLCRWIESATDRGGVLLCGGDRAGAVLAPTLVEHVQHDEPLWTEEAFGPVAVLEKYTDFKDALARVNDSAYGLQAGVFTRDIGRIQDAWDYLHVGGVVINDVPSFRVDNMPYGGIKDSGLGREGVRMAIEDMTEVRLLVIRNI
jgi:acyl-CoA reductase-like NAD-dependent aldehyde dehydrogenase